MIQQLVEVPVFSLKEDDIVYNQAHDLLQIVMGVDIPKNAFENEDDTSTVSIRAINAETYEFNKCHSDKPMKVWERVPLRAKVNKLITITDEDISALVKAKREITDIERKEALAKGEVSGLEIVYEEE